MNGSISRSNLAWLCATTVMLASFSSSWPLSSFDQSHHSTKQRSLLDESMAGPKQLQNNPDFVKFLSQNHLRLNSGTEESNPVLSDFPPLIKSNDDPKRNAISGESHVVSGNDQSNLLANATTVLCRSGFLSVYVEKDILKSTFNSTGRELSFRDSQDASCRSTVRASNETHFGLATLFGHCITVVTIGKDENGTKVQLVQNQVIFRPKSTAADLSNATNGTYSANRIQVVNITCTMPITDEDDKQWQSVQNSKNTMMPKPLFEIPDIPPLRFVDQDSTSASNQSFRLILSNKAWTGPEAETSFVKHPYPVIIGSRLYAQIQMVQPANDDDLKAHAKECFVSKNSDPLVEPRSKILTSGCSADRSVTLHHYSNLPMTRYTRLSFVIERIYGNYMFFQCKMVACSLRGGREREGYETCPNSTVCTDRTVDTRYTPMESPFSYVSSGLMRPIMPESSESTAGNTTCQPCPTVRPSALEPPHHDSVQVTYGVSVPTVIAIGIGSFILGLLLMGGLWWVHDRTEPKKYLTTHGKRRNSDRDSTSYASTATPNACTPMTKNGFLMNDAKGGTLSLATALNT